FVAKLSAALINKNYKIVSGFGLGIGSSVICGALEEIYMKQNNRIDDRLLLRPFPQHSSKQSLSALWTQYRDDMISHAGFSIFLFGNKQSNDEIVLSNGMREEYEISKNKKNIILPIGATGYMARELWEEEVNRLHSLPNKDDEFCKLFTLLGDQDKSLDEILDNIINIIDYSVKKGDLHG
ncbi:hypothetical protein G5I71_004894, partial [Escherichia coli]|nr:hypothetical protein [Escherichia coli]